MRLKTVIPLLLMLAVSCAKVENSAPEKAGIGFEAGVSLLREDGTKASDLITATSFEDDAVIKVFGRRVGEGKNTRIFGDAGVDVTYDSSEDEWTYSPPAYWYWVSTANYYDFLAAYPASGAIRMVDGSGADIPGNMAIRKSYSIDDDDYDLLLAGIRRTGANTSTRTGRVPLEFRHMLAAVRVRVTNESDAKALTLNSIHFDNLIHDASAKVTVDAVGEPEFSWIDTQRRADEFAFFTGSAALAVSATWEPSGYELLIPADLSDTIDGSLEADDDKVPGLIVRFTPAGADEPTEKRVPLKDIQKSRYGTDDPISVWEPGVKYTYHVIIRLDGGVMVTVITTEWEDIEAETPGLLIE